MDEAIITSEEAREARDALRLQVAQDMMRRVLLSAPNPRDLIYQTARDNGVADDWAAQVFWELVRLGFLSSGGGFGRRVNPSLPIGE